MLYLPPHIAHDDIAEGECMTASIGFRAPSTHELTPKFLYHLAERMSDTQGSSKADKRYRDS